MRVLIFLAMFLGTVAHAAERRIALVIGNGAYQQITPLANPVSDALLMSDALKKSGFDVILVENADQAMMKRAIAEFGQALREAGGDATGLFYYAGHAVQSFGNNYLLPVESAIQHQADLDLYGVEADWILRQLFAARIRTSIVILDACRNNPVEAVAGFDAQGLAEMDAPTGSFIAYATAPGRVALDGRGANSPYTKALVETILAEPMPIEQVFKDVRRRVLKETEDLQTPWESSSLTTDFAFLTSDGMTQKEDAEALFWASVKDMGVPAQIEFFLELYPDTRFRGEAEAALAEMQVEPDAPAPMDLPTDGLTFTTPIIGGGSQIDGRTIEEVFMQASPEFTPIEGLPDELWKGQSCSNCHQWSREALCDQGQVYAQASRALQKRHPLGGPYKEVLAEWAAGGCR